MNRQRELFGLSTETFLATSVLILLAPFVLVTPWSGWLSERLVASRTLRVAQALGVLILAAGGWAIGAREYEFGCICLFFKGIQSAVVGSAKYGALAEMVEDERGLVRGNMWLEALSPAGILLGTLAGLVAGELIADFGYSIRAMGAAALIAVPGLCGVTCAMWIPKLEATSSDERRGVAFLSTLRGEEGRFLSAMGVAWFWFLGAALFTVGPIYVGRIFEGGSYGFLFLSGVFGMGLIAGALLCRLMAKGLIELGLVPFASLGMSILLADLCWIGYPEQPIELAAIWSSWTGLRVVCDLFVLACLGGVFMLPLQSFIQRSLEAGEVSRIAAGVSWLSAIGMCIAGGFVVVMWTQGIEARWIFLTLAVMNFVVMLFVYHMLPRFVWAFMVWVLTQVMYRFTMEGREKIPMQGGAVISCNHPSFVDFMFVAAALSHRPPRFIMHHTFFKKPVVGWLFRDLDVIPIAPKSEDEELMQYAFDEVARSLEDGELVCIFPEGLVTFDGKLNAFRPGIERIIKRTPVPVIPLALKGLWGSFFSRDHEGQKAMKEPFRRFRAKIELIVGDAMEPESFSAKSLGEVTAQLGGWDPPRELNSEEDRAAQERSKSS